MRDLSVLNLADLHADNDIELDRKFNDSAEFVLDYCEKNPIDYAKIDGDIWNVPQLEPFFDSSKQGRGVKSVENFLTRLSKLVRYVVLIKGNNTHDAPGSISKLHQRYAKNILAYEYPVVLAFPPDGTFVDLFRNQEAIGMMVNGEIPAPEIIIPMMPYPSKAMLMEHASEIDKSNEQYVEIFEGLMTAFGLINRKFNCPKVMGFHGNIRGCKKSDTQVLTGQDIFIPRESFLKANCDFYNNGHIHFMQELIKDIMCYVGSWFNKDFGETEQKYINVVKFKVTDLKAEHPFEADYTYEKEVLWIPIATARPMQNFKIEWKDGNLVYEKPDRNYEAKIKFDIPENELAMLTDEKIEQLKKDFGADVKIEKNVQRPERASRSDKIMEATTEEQEVEEWLNVAHTDRKEELGLPVVDERIKLPKTMLEKISRVRDLVNKQEESEEEESEVSC